MKTPDLQQIGANNETCDFEVIPAKSSKDADIHKDFFIDVHFKYSNGQCV